MSLAQHLQQHSAPPPPLRFAERRIATLSKCYCVAPFTDVADPQRALFLAAAEQNDPCYLFDACSGAAVEKLWDAPGGVMSMVQLCEGDGRVVLATQQFYGPDDSQDAKLVLAAALHTQPPADAVETCAWRRFVLAEMPFLHRFDVVPGRGEGNPARYLIACTLKTGQHGPGDWSQPGRVLAARLPDDVHDWLPTDWQQLPDGSAIHAPLKWQVLHTGCLKSHGYSRHSDPKTGEVNCLVGWDAGLFLLRPPAVGDEERWDTTQLTSDPASDGTLVDLDGDGEEELVSIMPFHGDQLRIYRKDREGGVYRCAYTHPSPLPFLHAIWGGVLGGHPVVVLGHRAGARDLLLLSYAAPDGYRVDAIAHNCGPANVMVLRYADAVANGPHACVISCNRETDTVALYEVDAV